jgi:Zn-dependent protease with chaperone function
MGEARLSLLADFSWWVAWARPLAIALAAFAVLMLTTLAIAVAGRRLVGTSRQATWQVRAQRAAHVRSAFLFVRYGALAGVALAVGDSALLSNAQRAAFLLGCFWLYKVACLELTDPWERRILERPAATGRDWTREGLALLMFGLTVVYVACLPERYDTAGFVWLGLGVLALLALQSKWGASLVRFVLFYSPGQVCVEAVGRAARAMQVSAPQAVEIKGVYVNAFALHGANAVAFTNTAVALLSPPELEAVASHELAHLREPGLVRGMRMLLGLRPLALLAFFPALDESRALFCGLASWLALGFFERFFSRRLERRADAAASGDVATARTYAHTLLRLHELNLIPAHAAGTHPSLAERTAASVAVSLPRERASSVFGSVGLLAGVVITLAILGALAALRHSATISAPPQAGDLERFVAMRADASGLLLAGSILAGEGQIERANLAVRAGDEPGARFEASLLRAGLRARNSDCRAARLMLGAALGDCRTPDECADEGQHRCRAGKASTCPQLLQRELAVFFSRCPTPLASRD